MGRRYHRFYYKTSINISWFCFVLLALNYDIFHLKEISFGFDSQTNSFPHFFSRQMPNYLNSSSILSHLVIFPSYTALNRPLVSLGGL